jgi:hypothetical protein
MMEVSLVNDGPVTIVTDSHYLTFKKLIILDIILHLYSRFRQLEKNREVINRIFTRFSPLFIDLKMLYVNTILKFF